jgi:hypothetical protein
MSMQLTGRVSELEAKVRSLEEVIRGLIETIAESAPKPNVNGPRQMCPKCGVKPNYHLHVVNCKGPWQGNGAHP